MDTFQERAAAIRVVPPFGSPYSLPVSGSEEPGRTPTYRHWRFVDKPLMETWDPKVRTVHDFFEATVARQPNTNCFGHRPWDPVKKEFGQYTWMSYGTVAEKRAKIGAGIREVAKRAGITDDKFGVGLWSQNRPEWQITDLACCSQALYTVSLYETLGPTATEYIANHASLPVIVTSVSHIPTLLALKPKLPHLKVIISMDSLDAGEQPGCSKKDLLSEIAKQQAITLLSLDDTEKIGESLGPVKFTLPVSSDLVTINYTSGTTGNPKGVIITHKAAVAAVSASMCSSEIKSGDIGVSYLPLAHIYGRMLEQVSLMAGASIGYFHGNVLELVDDLKLLRPHQFQSVPRLFDRFGASIRAASTEQAGFKGALSRHVVSTKLENLKEPLTPKTTNKHFLWDRIWGRKVAAAIGLDRTRNMISGSAPLDPSLHSFLRIVFSNNFAQGWGMTETYATGLCQMTGDFATSTCGAVMPAHEMCLISVADMDYLVTDKPYPRGELLVRGPGMCEGYYRNEEETKASFLPGGWFKTGDIASVDELGRFKIIDRRKNVLKLAQGEYISPERIAGVYTANCPYLQTAYIHGDSLQTSLVALLGVNPELFAPFASKVLGRSISQEDSQAIQAACKDNKVRQAILADLDKVGRKHKFAGYERVRAIYLYLDPFTLENDLITPTLKIKRPQVVKKFRTELDELYAEVNAKPKAKL